MKLALHLKIVAIILITVLCLIVANPGNLLAFDSLEQACSTGSSGSSAACQDSIAQTGANNPVNETIRTATNLVALIAGIASVIMIILGGITFMSGGGVVSGQRSGDSVKGAAKGRLMVIGGVIGLVIVVLSWAITTFVVNNFIN